MKICIKNLIEKSIDKLKENGELPKDLSIDIEVTIPKNKKFGNYTTNVSLKITEILKNDYICIEFEGIKYWYNKEKDCFIY